MSTIYSFTVEDFTAPELDSIVWYTPRKCRIKWNERVSQSADPGGACFVKHLLGIEVVNSNQIRIRGEEPQSSWVGYMCQIANSHPLNNKARPILAISGSLITLDTSGSYGELVKGISNWESPRPYDDGVDKNDSGITVRTRTLKASISPYYLSARLSAEGASLLPNDPLRIQCAYLPLPKRAWYPSADELPEGEYTDQYTYLEFHQDISIRRLYSITAVKVKDASDNENEAVSTSLNFTSPGFGAPTNRIGFWSDGIIPPSDRKTDAENSFLLRKLAVILQDIQNCLWYRIDQIQYLNDPDLCPDDWVDHLLYNRGNPFRFEMPSLLFKRRLAAFLPSLYRKVGTAGGIEEFIYRLLGITVLIEPFIDEPSWLLGDATYGILGLTTKLGAGTSYEKNCYKVTIVGLGRPLTDWETRAIRDICEWADPIWMHLVQIDDGYEEAATGSTSLGWILGESYLGTETYLG